ncbi:MAG: hypothetical protein ACI8RZ_003388 [Myxococcota bacterium]|jgi:hypothetical protein
MINKPALLLGALALSGCGKLGEIQDTVEGITESFVVEGIYLGVEQPDDVDLSDTAFSGARFTAFLADAGQINEIEEAPIEGAALMLLSPGNGGTLPMVDGGGGKYELSADDGLEYVSGEEISLTSNYNDAARSLSVDAPPAPSLDIDPAHTSGTPMAVDLSGQGFDAALAVVMDVETGEITWSNEPQDISALYDMTHPGGIGFGESEDTDDTLIIEIPAKAFAAESYYIVGVAGMVVADTDTFENVNTALSTIMAGKLRFADVCTDDFALLCEG